MRQRSEHSGTSCSAATASPTFLLTNGEKTLSSVSQANVFSCSVKQGEIKIT